MITYQIVESVGGIVRTIGRYKTEYMARTWADRYRARGRLVETLPVL
jgi:hypothetical protein